MAKRQRIDQEIIDLLEEAEVDYHFKKGSKHLKLFVGNKLVAVLPHRGGTSSGIETGRNVILSVRRHLRTLVKVSVATTRVLF